jgi:hypothetical protein
MKYFILTFERRMMDPREESKMTPKICTISMANVALPECTQNYMRPVTDLNGTFKLENFFRRK